MNDKEKKIRRTGLGLFAVVMGLLVYSFFVVKHRGSLPEPENLTKTQKILRGL